MFGYTEAKLQAALAMIVEARQLANQQLTEYAEQYQATENVYTAWDASNKVYVNSLRIARIAFRKNIQAQTALMLNGRRNASLNGWLEQATTFYANMLPNAVYMAAMSEFGFTPERLQEEHAMMQNVRELNQNQQKEKGEAQHATLARDAKVEELADWMHDFFAIARIALADNPQWMEKLGVVVEA
ncbi:MAG: hypothetical protein JEZ03_09400 [Bacteroidales bacterium]|nr:hypothetical protein [Bacteroidales bacterium]